MATHSCSMSVIKSVYQPTSVAPVEPRLEGAARPPHPPSLEALSPVGNPIASPPCPLPSCLPRSPFPAGAPAEI